MDQKNNSNQPALAMPRPAALAPIAEQEVEVADEVSFGQQQPCSSSSAGVVPRKKVRGQQTRMIRRRPKKRREDPFGTLIHSTKKMKLNETAAGGMAGEGGEEEDGLPGEEEMRAIVHGKRGQQGGDMDGVVFAEDGEDELMFYYGGQDEGEDSDAEGYDDQSDSNAEDYYKNDYPDEEPHKLFGLANGAPNDLYENESTSEDDNFDHYGDENTKYRNYCYDEEEDNDGNKFLFSSAGILAKNKRKKELVMEDSEEEEEDLD